MLKSFQISNFNSIKESITFSMESIQELTEHPEFVTNLDKDNKLLKVASIYGPNASGKTNLLHALEFVRELISGRLSRENPRYRHNNHERYTPFEFTLEKDNLMKVSLLFARKGVEYWYRLTAEFFDEGNSMMIIHDEFLGVKRFSEKNYDVVFSREKNVIIANEILDIIGASKLPVSNDMTLLRHLYVNYINVEEGVNLASVEGEHLEFVADIYEEIRSLSLISNLSVMSSNIFRFNADRIIQNKEFIIQTLNNLDIQISDIYAKELGKRDYQIFCTHKVNEETYELRVEQESQGTALLIYLLSIIASRKNKPTIFLIDELDSHLHPKLVKEIISIFNSKLNKFNQLIFNSHDMWNMVPENFRRDQIWFTYRNEELATELTCLSDIVNYKGERIRKDAKYSKQYMEGKYGADPFIRKGLDWYGE